MSRLLDSVVMERLEQRRDEWEKKAVESHRKGHYSSSGVGYEMKISYDNVIKDLFGGDEDE